MQYYFRRPLQRLRLLIRLGPSEKLFLQSGRQIAKEAVFKIGLQHAVVALRRDADVFAVFALLDLITCLAQIFGNGFVLLIQHKRCHHLGNNGGGAGRILGGECLLKTSVAQGKYGNACIVKCQIIAVCLRDADGNGSHCLHVVLFQPERTFG